MPVGSKGNTVTIPVLSFGDFYTSAAADFDQVARRVNILDHSLGKHGQLPVSWNKFQECAQNQIQIFSALFDSKTRPVHKIERSAALEALILRHRQHEETWPLRVVMDSFCEMWNDYDARLKAALVQMFPETSVAGIRSTADRIDAACRAGGREIIAQGDPDPGAG